MKLEIDVNIRHVGTDELNDIKHLLAELFKQGKKMAESFDTLNAKVDTLETTISDERAETLAALKALKDIIAGAGDAQAKIDALGARLDTAISDVQGIITDADK